MTELEKRIRLLIEANGPMSVAEYMALVLGDPMHGYYATRDPFGTAGDFITAPEVSQMFGEIVGAWLVHIWREIGAPDPVRLVELGPGRGTLMADILRVSGSVPEFRAAVSVHLVETSPKLRVRQAETLEPFDAGALWHETIDAVPSGPLLLVANEFFDALPIRQFVRADGAWRERAVGIDRNGRFAFGFGAAKLPLATNAPDGAVLELRPAADAIASAIARRIVAEGGAALIIDYGYVGPLFGNTLQAVRGHAFTDPLATLGEADLTAHVDFNALARAASEAGAAAQGPIGQGEFLLALGLQARAEKLAANAAAATRETLRSAVERLAGADAMGTLFKAMAITRRSFTPPPFPTRV